mmetsp:Transcript_75596/g.162064  ORF Transcript_75596/g.162064 Transcript_75596/m.162064 type:complete len:265 (-) Transcript_75596:25-819(-)
MTPTKIQWLFLSERTVTFQSDSPWGSTCSPTTAMWPSLALPLLATWPPTETFTLGQPPLARNTNARGAGVLQSNSRSPKYSTTASNSCSSSGLTEGGLNRFSGGVTLSARKCPKMVLKMSGLKSKNMRPLASRHKDSSQRPLNMECNMLPSGAKSSVLRLVARTWPPTLSSRMSPSEMPNFIIEAFSNSRLAWALFTASSRPCSDARSRWNWWRKDSKMSPSSPSGGDGCAPTGTASLATAPASVSSQTPTVMARPDARSGGAA